MKGTRLERYRKKNQPLMISLKAMFIFYVILFSVSYLTSNTVAYFMSEGSKEKIMITAGTWDEEEQPMEDEAVESLLSFVEQEDALVATCSEAIEIEIVNNGNGPMVTEGAYDVYYSENGDPEIDGEKIELPEGEGMIGILESGETMMLSYEASAVGFYTFVVYQDSELEDIWSNVIHVECETEQEVVEQPEVDGAKDDQLNEEAHTEENNEIEEGNEDPEENTEESEQDTQPVEEEDSAIDDTEGVEEDATAAEKVSEPETTETAEKDEVKHEEEKDTDVDK